MDIKVGDIIEVDPSWRGVYSRTAVSPFAAVSEIRQVQFVPSGAAPMFYVTGRDTNGYSQTWQLANAKKATGPAVDAFAEKLWDYRKAHLGPELMNRFAGVTLGTDPEIFVEDKTGKLIPAFKFLPDKKNPGTYLARWSTAPERTYAKESVYWDGFQAEFTVPPQNCLAHLADCVRSGMVAVLQSARKVDPFARLSAKTVVDIPPEVLEEASSEHVELGCDTSMNIYSMAGCPVSNGRGLNVRFVGGHLHFGSKGLADRSTEIIGALDMLVGIPGVGMFEHWDNPVRRAYYGLPGEHRLPPHGIEYRTLSNAWMRHPALMHLTFEMARLAVSFGFQGFHKLWNGDSADVPRIIAEGDVDAARKAVVANEKLFKDLLGYKFQGIVGGFESAYAMMREGAHKFMAAPDDMHRNWSLEGVWAGHSENPNAQWSKASRTINQGNLI